MDTTHSSFSGRFFCFFTVFLCSLNHTVFPDHAGKSIFTLFSAIKQQLNLGPQDEITFEAKSSLNNEKMLREKIDFKRYQGTVRDLNLKDHPVTLLSCDSIRQTKTKCIEAIYRNRPASQLPNVDSFDLMYVGSNKSVVLRENHHPVSVI